MMRKRTVWMVTAATVFCGWTWVGQANAAIPYSEGFETAETGGDPYTSTNPPYDWSLSTDISTTSAITRVASGGGTLGLTAASGGYYAELTNGENGYTADNVNGTPGYGDAGYSFLGGHAAGAYPGSAFKQSMSVYLDTSWGAASNSGSPAFWIDMTASGQTSGTYDFGTEHNFRIMSPSSGTIGIRADGSSSAFASVTSSGWYTFEMIYAKGASGSDPSTTTLNVLDASGNSLGSTILNNSSLSSDLGGSGYEWVTLWQNGFAGDHLGIDNVQTSSVPEPASLGLLACGGLLALRRRRRRSVR